jgi:hypothetical protein
MWDALSHADLEGARQQIQDRRQEMLRRHAEELAALERDQLEIETLDQLIRAFLNKFIDATALAAEPGTSEEKDVDEEDSNGVQVTASVSLLITQAQRRELQELGIADERIRTMKPNEAHRLLGVAS